MALFLFSYTSFEILFKEHRYAQKTLNWLQFGYTKLTFSRPVAKSSYRYRLEYGSSNCFSMNYVELCSVDIDLIFNSEVVQQGMASLLALAHSGSETRSFALILVLSLIMRSVAPMPPRSVLYNEKLPLSYCKKSEGINLQSHLLHVCS